MGIRSFLRGKKLVFLGSGNENGYEVDYSRPWDDSCGKCGHKLYFAKDIFSEELITDIVICCRCGATYKLVTVLLSFSKDENERKEKKRKQIDF